MKSFPVFFSSTSLTWMPSKKPSFSQIREKHLSLKKGQTKANAFCCDRCCVFLATIWSLQKAHQKLRVYIYIVCIPAPSKGCQLNPNGWWIDTRFFRNHFLGTHGLSSNFRVFVGRFFCVASFCFFCFTGLFELPPQKIEPKIVLNAEFNEPKQKKQNVFGIHLVEKNPRVSEHDTGGSFFGVFSWSLREPPIKRNDLVWPL